MGWSHYDFAGVSFTVDCHGAEEEREQELLYRAFCHELNDRILEIVGNPVYEAIHPEFWDEGPEPRR